MSDVMTATPADLFVGMQNSPNTKRAYRNDISKWQMFLAARDGKETPETAVAFKQELEEVYAPATAQRIWCTVAAFYGWMKGVGHIEVTPFHGIKSPTRYANEQPPVPSDDEVAALLYAADDGTLYGVKATLTIALLLNGLRAQEVCNATFEDLTYDEHTRTWVLEVLGKGNKWRTVPLNSITQQAIYEYYLNNRVEDNYIIPAMSGGQMNIKSVWRMVDHYAKKAGVTGIHPHALRHHYATRLVRNKVDIFTLQKLLGHTRADTTQRYVGLDYSDLARAIEIDPLHNPHDIHDELFTPEREYR